MREPTTTTHYLQLQQPPTTDIHHHPPSPITTATYHRHPPAHVTKLFFATHSRRNLLIHLITVGVPPFTKDLDVLFPSPTSAHHHGRV
ncbi:hypothetical protein SOVF_058000 [Spinacia oleracea]|nr:hypothetical protein SOVF_058000 [Spinacia oleracea]